MRIEMTIDKLEAMYLKELADHQLTVICDHEKVKCYRMGKPGTGIMSTYITSTPCGIVLQGDFTPQRNGSTSTRGYDLDWFAGASSTGYLAEKFLEQRFIKELAEAALKDASRWSDCDEEQQRRIMEMADEIGDHDIDLMSWLYDEFVDMGFDTESIPGYGYEPREIAALGAIQKTFSRLYWNAEAARPA
jgi:hypothetical protein